jgi:hypothetical protein
MNTKILNHSAIISNGQINILLPNEDAAVPIVLQFSNLILDNKVKLLRISLPNKIITISAKDSNHLSFRAEYNTLN